MSARKKPPIPDIESILDDLKYIADGVQANTYFCKNVYNQLGDCGYSWPFRSDLVNPADMVLKLFAVAVNEAIQKKVNLTQLETGEQLRSKLDIREHESLSLFFSSDILYMQHKIESKMVKKMPAESRVLTWMKEARSPLDMAVCLKRSVPQWLVVNIIQYQFDIRWSTPSDIIGENGKPNNYTFYQFCEMQNSREFLKYRPRLAHVKATLYKERTTTDVFLGNFLKEKLCPNVFVRTSGGWKSWNAYEENYCPEDFDARLSWMNESILTFIEENADIQRDDEDSLDRTLDKPTLYWAVLDDTDFEACGNLKLKEIGRTQVYVGKASNGIRGRWTKDGDNHCHMIKKCLDNVNAMTTYDPLRLEGIQLVDARLALAKVRRERSALFVIKTFGDDVEKAEIAVDKAEEAYEEATDSEEEERFYEREEAKSTLDELKKILKESTKLKEIEKANWKLEDAEKMHRIGKRHDSTDNIIPSSVYKIKWQPKNMAYGMNFY